MQKAVAVNERGLRIGEDHQNARYTNGEIEMVLTLRDDGKSYGEIARLVENIAQAAEGSNSRALHNSERAQNLQRLAADLQGQLARFTT